MNIKIIAVLLLCLCLTGISVFSADNEMIIDVNDPAFSKTGSWEITNLGGYNQNYIISAEASDGSSCSYTIKILGGVYDFYIWNSLKDDGCPDAEIIFSCTTAYDTKTINMSRGVTGFKYIGTYNISDGMALASISGKTGKLLASAIKLVPSDGSGNLDILRERLGNYLALSIDNHNSLLNGRITEIPDVTPTLNNGVTLIPLRFVATAFDYTVDWDEDKAEATLKKDENTLKFYAGSSNYVKNGEALTLGTETIIINGRMMVPLRIISESISKNVFWNEENRLIIVSDNKFDRSDSVRAIEEAIKGVN